jgi:UDP-N-acetyl-D-glucosamine dehydrogenase
MRPILEATGMKSGVDFFLAFSPEREDPGNPNYHTATIPKVVGGDGEDASKVAEAFYSHVVAKVVPVSSCEVAEAVKLTENIFRSVNIALVNELKVIYDRMGINVWEVIDAAKTKPFGYMPFYPGPGLGGHCIPIDPFYLTWKAREYGVPTRFIELAGEINTQAPYFVIEKLVSALSQHKKKAINGARILMLGIAYKKNVEDTRESPSFVLLEELETRGAKVDFYDPFVPVIPHMREHASMAGRRSVTFDPSAFGEYDAVLVCTDHDNVDYAAIAKACDLVIDTRNAMRSFTHDGVVRA